MKVLIAYASKTGTTEKCAKILKALVDDATLCNLDKEKPDLSEYNCVIVGGSIRMGKLHKTAAAFIKKNYETLLKKKSAYFICNCFSDQSESYLRKNIPEGLMKHALAVSSFGGELNIDNQKGFDKMVTKLVAAKKPPVKGTKLQTSSEAINLFSERIK